MRVRVGSKTAKCTNLLGILCTLPRLRPCAHIMISVGVNWCIDNPRSCSRVRAGRCRTDASGTVRVLCESLS